MAPFSEYEMARYRFLLPSGIDSELDAQSVRKYKLRDTLQMPSASYVREFQPEAPMTKKSRSFISTTAAHHTTKKINKTKIK